MKRLHFRHHRLRYFRLPIDNYKINFASKCTTDLMYDLHQCWNEQCEDSSGKYWCLEDRSTASKWGTKAWAVPVSKEQEEEDLNCPCVVSVFLLLVPEGSADKSLFDAFSESEKINRKSSGLTLWWTCLKKNHISQLTIHNKPASYKILWHE